MIPAVLRATTLARLNIRTASGEAAFAVTLLVIVLAGIQLPLIDASPTRQRTLSWDRVLGLDAALSLAGAGAAGVAG
jgi:hypothetical protein